MYFWWGNKAIPLIFKPLWEIQHVTWGVYHPVNKFLVNTSMISCVPWILPLTTYEGALHTGLRGALSKSPDILLLSLSSTPSRDCEEKQKDCHKQWTSRVVATVGGRAHQQSPPLTSPWRDWRKFIPCLLLLLACHINETKQSEWYSLKTISHRYSFTNWKEF